MALFGLNFDVAKDLNRKKICCGVEISSTSGGEHCSLYMKSQNCPCRKAPRAIWKTLKIQVKLILNCPRAHVVTCSSHKRQNSVQQENFEGLAVTLTGLLVVIKEQASRRRGKAFYNSKQNTAISILSKQFLYK